MAGFFFFNAMCFGVCLTQWGHLGRGNLLKELSIRLACEHICGGHFLVSNCCREGSDL